MIVVSLYGHTHCHDKYEFLSYEEIIKNIYFIYLNGEEHCIRKEGKEIDQGLKLRDVLIQRVKYNKFFYDDGCEPITFTIVNTDLLEIVNSITIFSEASQKEITLSIDCFDDFYMRGNLGHISHEYYIYEDEEYYLFNKEYINRITIREKGETKSMIGYIKENIWKG